MTTKNDSNTQEASSSAAHGSALEPMANTQNDQRGASFAALPGGSATPEPCNEAEYRSRIAHIFGSKKGRVVWRWQFEWKLSDLWIGVFWKRTRDPLLLDALHVWVCLLPCVPLHLWQEWVAEESPNDPSSASTGARAASDKEGA